jgi:hypothetical protein
MSSSASASTTTTTSNVVLDKIPCLFKIEYDKVKKMTTVVSDAPAVVNVSQPLHVSRKLDGECCWFQDKTGTPMRRLDIKNGKTPPADWVRTGELDDNGHTIGFIPIATDPSAKYMREALDMAKQEAVILNRDTDTTRRMSWAELAGKTVEFVGPKVQGNPCKLSVHCFAIHGEIEVPQAEVPFSSYVALQQHMRDHPLEFEGYVGRVLATGELFKITRSHLGLPWKGRV